MLHRLEAADRLSGAILFFRSLASSLPVEVFATPDGKGMGLRSLRRFNEGEVLFQEQPFASGAWNLGHSAQDVAQNATCRKCGRLSHHDRAETDCSQCGAVFCSQACHNDAEATFHPVLCQNYAAYLSFERWCCSHYAHCSEADVSCLSLLLAGRILCQLVHGANGGEDVLGPIKHFSADVEADFASPASRDLTQQAHSLLIAAIDRAALSTARYLLELQIYLLLVSICTRNACRGAVVPRGSAAEVPSVVLVASAHEHGCLSSAYLAHLVASINHSCEPNAKLYLSGGQVIVGTLRGVSAGEEVTISYFPTPSSVFVRALHASAFGFRCGCAKCIRQRQMVAHCLQPVKSLLGTLQEPKPQGRAECERAEKLFLISDSLFEQQAPAEKLLEVLNEGAEHNSQVCHHRLGCLYLRGDYPGIAADTKRGVSHLAAASLIEHANAPRSWSTLARLLAHGTEGLPQDRRTAVALFVAAGDQDDLEAQLELGELFDALEKPSEAFKWYLRAAQQGHAPSQILVADRLEKGIGVSVDVAQAEKWRDRAHS